MIELIDVSPHQHRKGGPGIDWKAVAASGVRGVYLRAFEGKDLDEHPGGYSFERHRQAALDAGLLVGAYQYLRARHRGAWQAEQLLVALGELGPRELPPAVDIETLDGRPVPEAQACLIDWIATARRALGRDPVVYTYPHFWASELRGEVVTEAADCPLWIAHYGVSRPIIPRPWQKAVCWQTTGSGTCPGIEGAVDRNVWLEGNLEAFAGARC